MYKLTFVRSEITLLKMSQIYSTVSIPSKVMTYLGLTIDLG